MNESTQKRCSSFPRSATSGVAPSSPKLAVYLVWPWIPSEGTFRHLYIKKLMSEAAREHSHKLTPGTLFTLVLSKSWAHPLARKGQKLPSEPMWVASERTWLEKWDLDS